MSGIDDGAVGEFVAVSCYLARTKRAFTVIRPPEHPCREDTPSGFRVVNNVAIGAPHARLHSGTRSAALTDFMSVPRCFNENPSTDQTSRTGVPLRAEFEIHSDSPLEEMFAVSKEVRPLSHVPSGLPSQDPHQVPRSAQLNITRCFDDPELMHPISLDVKLRERTIGTDADPRLTQTDVSCSGI
ncbi:hypothetical protein FB45DRAFT_1021629 [Roridomyces roridus]|uniref:Histone deacetylase domain-containing protein n=1 Tax=Roridomyces roridus TaxID=1738132 RepID=A0AAD7CCH3_9AGAR|nr:hypothetical protein FB45DRAFT_1021629 [Roridomyces roridus]